MPTGNSISLPTGVSGPSCALAFGQSFDGVAWPHSGAIRLAARWPSAKALRRRMGPFWGHPPGCALAFGQSFGGVRVGPFWASSSTGTKGAGDNGRNGACSSTILGRSAVQWENPAAKSGVSIEELERIR